MQPMWETAIHRAFLSCSTLRRVEPHATSQRVLGGGKRDDLAVPSDGSNLMQPASVAHQSRACKPLQYPQTGRTSCNFFLSLFTFPATCLQYLQTGRTSCKIAADLRCIGARDLAVPSDGSNLMQL